MTSLRGVIVAGSCVALGLGCHPRTPDTDVPAPRAVVYDAGPPLGSSGLPVLIGHMLEPVPEGAVVVDISPTDISVDGESLATPLELVENELGVRAVTNALAARVSAGATIVAHHADPAAPYGHLRSAIASATAAGFREQVIVVETEEGLAAVSFPSGPIPGEEIPEWGWKLPAMELADRRSEPTQESVLTAIRGDYMAQIKRCHRDALSRGLTASGTVTLKFVVGPSGKVVRAAAHGFDPSLDACIERRMVSWVFGIPRDDAGATSTADFEIAIALDSGVDGEALSQPPDAARIDVDAAELRAWDSQLSFVVSSRRGQLLLYSQHGAFATKYAPIELGPVGEASAADLRRTLSSLLERFAVDVEDRPRRIMFVFEYEVPVQAVVHVLAAVRRGPDGVPMFTEPAFGLDYGE